MSGVSWIFLMLKFLGGWNIKRRSHFLEYTLMEIPTHQASDLQSNGWKTTVLRQQTLVSIRYSFMSDKEDDKIPTEYASYVSGTSIIHIIDNFARLLKDPWIFKNHIKCRKKKKNLSKSVKIFGSVAMNFQSIMQKFQ